MATTPSSSTALTKRAASSDNSLMLPPPPPKRIKRPPKVLDEETYTSALSHIIARDFFPGLLESESQQDYLDALEAGDEEWIDEAEKKVREVMSTPRYGRGRRGVNMTPLRGLGSETPRGWAGDTPSSVGRSLATPGSVARSQSAQKEDEVDLHLGLTAFQAKYTSEDNESFNKVLDKQNIKRADNYRWMWNGNKIPSARQIAQAAREQKLLRSSEQTPTNHNREGGRSQALVVRPSQDLDARPASITIRPTMNPRNNLMFHATEDITSTHPHLTTVADTAQTRSNAPPKSVSYTSTRLQTALNAEDEPTDPSIPDSPSLSAIDAAISGHQRHRPTSTLAPSSTTSASETPRVNGYGFVDAEPTPSELGIPPSRLPNSISISTSKSRDRADLLTAMIEADRNDQTQDSTAWGPGASSSSGGANPFTIHGASARESLHHRIVDKNLASKRPSAAASSSRLASLQHNARATHTPTQTQTPTPRFSSAPLNAKAKTMAAAGLGAGSEAGTTPSLAARGAAREDLTPAAQRLYDRVGRTPGRVGGGGAFDFEKAVGRGGGGGRGSGRDREWDSTGEKGTSTNANMRRSRRDSLTPLGVRRAASGSGE